MTERLGIEIDYCPQCRGVWLDRGELDKIMERSMDEFTQNSPAIQLKHQVSLNHDNSHEYSDKHHDNHQGYRGKQSFWKELFD
jgi:Zn-finger nucleic acid-binding protein